MNELTTTESSTAISQTLSALSPGLKSLLGLEPSDQRAISELARNPVLLAEAKSALPAIKARATVAATPKEIEMVIGLKFATFRQPERSEAEWAMFWAEHHRVLGDVPLPALRAGMDAIADDPKAEFLPKPAKIREIAMTTVNRAAKAYSRARKAIELADGGAGSQRFSPEELQARRAQVANLLAELGGPVARR